MSNPLPEIMTLEEVARYLRVSDRTVYDWAQRGEIPCGKIGTVWRFLRPEIEKWARERITASRSEIDLSPLQLASVLTPGRAFIIDSATKQEILEQLIERLASGSEVKSRAELVNGIFQREKLMSTGIGFGIAIPHVRLRSVRTLALAAALVRNGVPDYESLDQIPVRLIFMIIARDDQHAQHLRLLSQLSAGLKDENHRAMLLDCADDAAFFAALTGREA